MPILCCSGIYGHALRKEAVITEPTSMCKRYDKPLYFTGFFIRPPELLM